MPRKRDPRRDEAFEIWQKSKGERKLKDIAAELDVGDSQIRKWKSQDKWNDKLKGNVTNSKRNVTKHKGANRIRDATPKIEKTLLSDELTDKQRLFCMYYLKYFNATKAYQKAYDCAYSTAMVNGHGLLRNTKVNSEIDRMKEEHTNGLKLDTQVILQKYIDIALADINDYLTYGQKEIKYIDDLGKRQKTKVNFVDFNDSSEVDGTIITEVKQGKDGASIKLADKMKALDKLWEYFDMLPETYKEKLQQEKLKADIAKTKAETEKISTRDNDGPIEIMIKRKGDG